MCVLFFELGIVRKASVSFVRQRLGLLPRSFCSAKNSLSADNQEDEDKNDKTADQLCHAVIFM